MQKAMSLPVAQVVISQAGATMDALRPAMPVTVGQTINARVVTNANGQLELAVGNQRLVAMSDVPLEPGEALRLLVKATDEQRVQLQLVSRGPADGGEEAAAGRTAGQMPRLGNLPAATGQTLLATLAQMGMTELEGNGAEATAARAAIAARATAAGVSTPAQAAAFARLLSAGLPTTPAAVAGMAELAEGPPLGRMLAMITGPATSATTPAAAAATPQAAGAAAAAVAGQAADEAATTGTANGSARAGALTPPPATTAAAANTVTAGTTAAATAARPGETPMGLLATAVRNLAEAAASGDPARLREAVVQLGHGLEHRLANGTAPDAPDVRTLLMSLANASDTALHTRGMAERAADAIATQAFVAPALNPNAADAAQQGAYLQMPLPGGQTAEVHINPDQGGDGAGGSRGTRVAFLLTMSHLGPLMIEAHVGAHGVDATVRSQAPAVREYLTGQTPELVEGLSRALPQGGAARVNVDRMKNRNETPGMIPPPPSPGLDIAA